MKHLAHSARPICKLINACICACSRWLPYADATWHMYYPHLQAGQQLHLGLQLQATPQQLLSRDLLLVICQPGPGRKRGVQGPRVGGIFQDHGNSCVQLAAVAACLDSGKAEPQTQPQQQ